LSIHIRSSSNISQSLWGEGSSVGGQIWYVSIYYYYYYFCFCLARDMITRYCNSSLKFIILKFSESSCFSRVSIICIVCFLTLNNSWINIQFLIHFFTRFSRKNLFLPLPDPEVVIFEVFDNIQKILEWRFLCISSLPF